MTLKDLMKMLVETEDKDQRMQLVEDNQALMEVEGNPNNEEVETLKAKVTDLESKVQAEKQKYIDRFFSGEELPKKEDEEDEEVETKSLSEILGE